MKLQVRTEEDRRKTSVASQQVFVPKTWLNINKYVISVATRFKNQLYRYYVICIISVVSTVIIIVIVIIIIIIRLTKTLVDHAFIL